MNNKHILDLTFRLFHALDQNYDVVSMDTVLSVISALEGTTITKEQLEATRLAKYINHLRRRTKCENLAKRAKSLLKKWREMVGMQQSNESSLTATGMVYAPAINVTTISTQIAASNMTIGDNAVSASHLTNPQFIHNNYQRQQQYQSNVKQQQFHKQPYHSQPPSPINVQEQSNPNECLISMSNPATSSQIPKSSSSHARKKRKIDKNISNESVVQQNQPQPTSFANLITGIGDTLSLSRKSIRDKNESNSSKVKPVETFIIEHSSNSNSDLICIQSNNTVSNFTSVNNVPPVVIDLQDTNSSMNSLVSKDITNASSSVHRNKNFVKKSKKDRKRRDRNVMSRQSQHLHDCDDQNTKISSYQNKIPSEVLLLDEKSHSACPTISNISEILSLSNSSMSSMFRSADAMSKNIFHSDQNDVLSSTARTPKADLTFAGKFKQNTSSTSTGCIVLNYGSESMNTNVLSSKSPSQNKFSLFGGIGANSNGSSSSSQNTSFRDVVNAVKKDKIDSRHTIEDGIITHDINEKSTSNMSNKGNSSTDNAFPSSASTAAVEQRQQSIDLTTMDASSEQTAKQPKKRGRKKGSKGVDSVIAKETSLSSQMLISSLGVAGKKVKTTKELYAEMEKRKLRNVKATELGEMLGNSLTNCVEKQQQMQLQKPMSSRRSSFCSDIGDTDSCTMTSEPSRDSGNIISKTAVIIKHGKPLGNNCNVSKHGTDLKIGDVKSEESSTAFTDASFVIETTSKIKLEIQEILKLLAPPLSVTEIEYECCNSTTPCTCTIENVEMERTESIGDNCSKDLIGNAIDSTNMSERERKQLPLTVESIETTGENVKRVDNDRKYTLSQQLPSAKVKKSIFDLDFDDDEDPLNLIIADIAGKSVKAKTDIIKTTPQVVGHKDELPLIAQDGLGDIDHKSTPYALIVPTLYSNNIISPSYNVLVDPNCKARIRFETQTQEITKFHIDTLHNFFIPNVNGNWNHADAVSERGDIRDEDPVHKIDLVIDGYDVVPLYGWDVKEKIIKDFSHVIFTNKIDINHSKSQKRNAILFQIPFLGVSRIPNTNLPTKVIKILTLDEEKENVDNKLNLNNNKCNANALDINSAKEKEEQGMEGVQHNEALNSIRIKAKKHQKKSGFKRTKKHATLVKRSTLRSLKLTAKKNFARNRNDTDCGDELKLHRSLFYHDELRAPVQNISPLYKEYIFKVSSCSSSCSSAEEETTNKHVCRKKRTRSTSTSSCLSSLSSSSSEYNMLNLQQKIIEAEIVGTEALAIENSDKIENNEMASHISLIKNDNVDKNCIVSDNDDDYGNKNGSNGLPKENNHMLLSFNNIYKKITRDDNAEKHNKDHGNNMLKQQLQNCDDYNNFNLIKYINNKNSSIHNNNNNNYNNNNNKSCSNKHSDKNINISSSSCIYENPTNSVLINQPYNNNDKDVQIKPFKEYQTGIRAVDEDVNDDDGNNCGRLQQFKEWHEVLQLRSYNDELLTVFPYVVLE